METVVRIDHGQSQASTMSYPQRQPANHRQNHAQQELYKPARSPLPPSQSRYPFPGSPQLQPQVNQLSSQRYNLSAAAQQTGYRDYRQHRISLLHPEYGSRPREVLQGGASIHHLEPIPGLGQQPFKKIRLQDHKDVQPLRIDTREQPGVYNPQVEAISPTLPDHIQQEDQAFRTTKDELLQQIGKVDREIAKTESQISILRKKQQELEESALKPNQKSEVEEDNQPKHQSLAQKIYAENRKKAQSSHAKLDNLGPKVDWPIYNQPLDTPVYHENKRKHLAFKRRLLEYFKKRQADKETRNSYLTETYSKMMQEWLRKVDKIESSTKRKAKEAKNREFFEKVFPEIRKQREDKESGPRVVKRLVPDLVKQQRFIRVGARIKSEADMDDFIDNLQEQEVEDKKMRSYAVIPPLMLDAKERKLVYQNNNGHIADMGAVHKSRQFLNIWTRTEKEIFKEKYLQHPKNFHVISSYLEKKSVSDCVEYYYLSKKTENYKQLLRKSKMRPRTRNNPQKANAPAVDILTPGVTTRLQREQQQKTGVQPTRDNTSDISTSVANTSTTPPNSSTPTLTTSTSTVSTTSVTSSAVSSVTSCDVAPTPTSTPCSVISSTSVASTITSVMVTSVAAPSVIKNEPTTDGGNATGTGEDSKNSSDLNSADGGKKFLNDVVVKVENNSSSNDGSNNETPLTPMMTTVKKEEGSTENSGSDQNLSSSAVVENKKKKERRKDKENSQLETSEDESPDLHDKSVQGQCIVCGSQLGPQLQSRPLAPNQASLYGLREEQIPPNGRVCNTCRCKCVRSRYTHCPLPSCPNARGRVKRLRSFPQRLQELPPDIRDPLLVEFHIPSGVTKCCSACFNRIQRRLGPVEEWPEEEIAQLRTALTEIGPNWSLVGMRLNKPPLLVRSFYATNRKALSLESCLGDRKPTLTDEEESGSSTSSCEEPLRERHSSDTVSAESPPVNHEQPTNPVRKEDYDSSATETADESQTPDHYQGSATITPVNNDGQPRQNTSPLTVKDLMLNVIEISLMKTSGAQQNPHLTAGGITPTISSILNNDSNEVTIVSEYNLNNQPRPQRNELSIAKLVTPLIGATITPVPAPVATQEVPSRDDLVVLQVQDGRDNENLTLDLSIKKNRELPPPAHVKHTQQQIRTEAYLYHTQERKSPAVYVSARVQPKLPSPKPANPKAGSITLGTPIISQQQRYDGLLRHVAPEQKMGSITQGTPIHVSHVQDKRIYESFYNKRAAVPQNVGQNPNFPAQYRQPAYSIDQQLSNRQIIMNDYITSQQMLGRRNDKPTYYATSSPHRTPPPQQSQQRQGVIQRHTRPHYPPPGHEALSSLVDVAVQQPSLPVPSAPHEGLGKTIADNILEQPHRFQNMMHQQQMRQQQQRMEAERRAYHQQQQQQAARQQQQQQVARSDSSTLTAASLIDAIITHQINQTEPGREVVTNNREPPRPGDRLFQGFHREAPSAQQDNNGDRPPSVISVDLDSDTVNKNLTVKELTDSVISHDFNARGSNYFHHQENVSEQWKRRLQQQQQAAQQQKEEKRSGTPQQDERQIIRIAQPQKYHVEPVSPPESNHWSEQNYRRYQQPQSHLSAFDYVKNRIVEVMRTEDDKKESQEGGAHVQDKDRSDSPGDMVIDEEKHENEFANQQPQSAPGFSYPYVAQKDNNTANDSSRNTEPKPLLSAQYEPLSDED